MKINPNPGIIKHEPKLHGGLYSIKSPKPGVIDFSSNINPLGCHPGVKKYIKKQMELVPIYPDSSSSELKKNLKWYTKVPEDQIVIGNGATEIIYNFSRAFLNTKTRVLIPIPTFSEYEAASELQNSKIRFFETMNINHDLDQFLKEIPKNGCVFLCNPNNPTGIIIPRKSVQKILKNALKKSTLVFVDECFIELSDPKQSCIKDLKNFENLFVLRSLTKSFGLAGMRIGYGLGNKKIISILNKINIPWNVSGISQKAASASICYYDYLNKSRKIIPREAKFLRKAISKIDGFSCLQTDANFILIKTKIKSSVLQKKLLKKNILVRNCDSFRGLNQNYIRIAIKNHSENLKLLKALEAI